MRESLLGKRISVRSLWPLLLPTVLLLPGLGAFPYPSPDANDSDLSITHYANATFLRRSIIEWGQIPLWSPTILSGYPFAANSLSGLWYPLGWLALLFPLPFGFNIVLLLHLLLGGLGMYLFIRALGRSHQAALFGALAFEALPKVFAHYGAGHLTMVYAIMLTPWLLLAEVRSWQPLGSFGLRQPGILLALIALADPRWAVYAGLLWATFSLLGSSQALRIKLDVFVKQSILALALAAPLLLPLLEYSQLSTRAQLAPADLLAYSFPPAGLLGFLAPQFGGFHEWIIYAGVIVLILALIPIVRTNKQKMDWLWIGIAITTILFSLGENMPGMTQLAQLPGLSLLRVPPRILPLASIGLIVLAAGAFDGLLHQTLDPPTWRRMRLAFTAIVGLQAGLMIISWLLTKEAPITYLWAIAVGLFYSLLLFLFSARRISASMLWMALFAATLIDLGVMDASLFSPHSKTEVLAEGAEASEFLARQPGQFRIYSPSYSIPQQTAAEFGLELADGVDPLQLTAYANFMEQATGVVGDGYSITLPPFAKGDPVMDNQLAVPDVNKLALLNVGYVASEFEMNVDGLEPEGQFGQTNVYRLAETLPRAYIEDAPEKAVTITEWTPNRIEIAAEGPGRLVLSELIYPGWVATVDGKSARIVTFHGILRSVELVDGMHEIIFVFHPLSVYAGLAILSLTIVVLGFSSRRRGNKKQ